MRICESTDPQPPYRAVLKGMPTTVIFTLGKVSPGYHPKDPDVSQYLDRVMSSACLQELKAIPDHEMKSAECKDQLLSAKAEMAMGHRMQKGACAEGLSATE